MPCYKPMRGYRATNGGWCKRLAFAASPPEVLNVPCGQCVGCRLERSRQWAVRIMHESQSWDQNAFLTLTYENLDHGPSLEPKHFTDFMKRLRKKHTGQTIRYYQCGEYGETTRRPHHHAAMFNYWPDDAKILKMSGEHTLYESAQLSEVWGHGHVNFGTLTFESAAYVARYITKKITGEKARDHYTIEHDGEYHLVKPEYSTMSRRPGIGGEWFKKYGQDTYEKDQVIMRGKAMRPPRAYDKKMEEHETELFEAIKRDREAKRIEKYGETPEFSLFAKPDPEELRRLHAGNTIQEQKLQQRKNQ